MLEALCRQSSTTLDIVHAEDGPPITQRTSGLEVRGEGATLRVPLDGSMAALGRLETCFEKNSRTGVDNNPFVAPNRKP